MKKRSFSLVIIFILLISIYIYLNNENKYLQNDDIIGVYVNNELNSEIPSKGSAMFQKAVCDDTSTKVTWDNDVWGLLISNLNKKVKCNLYFYSGQTVFDYDYTGDAQEFIAPVSGTYNVELWGASGDDIQCENGSNYLSECFGTDFLENSFGRGAYTKGNILLKKDEKLFTYVGGKTGYNGGGGGEARGGGATDIRTAKDNLYSRIIVAGGGGGGMYKNNITLLQVGSAGGLIGYDADSKTSSGLTGYAGHGATQSSGGKTGENGWDNYEYNEKMDGSFGQAGYSNPASSGGGGWYGGGHGRHTGGSWPGGGGGSSYISGHQGCLAVSSSSSTNLKNGCTKDSNSLECSISYTGYYFTDTLMIDGEGYRWTDKKEEQIGMPSHSDNSTITGNTGNGYARITLISIDE